MVVRRIEWSSPSWWPCVALSVVAVGLSTCVGYVLSIVWNLPVVFLPFFPAVMKAAWFGGRRAGYLTLALSLPPALHFLPPRGVWTLRHGLASWALLLIFAAMAGALVELLARVRISGAARNALVSVAGHELKQPLSAVVLEAEVIRRLSASPAQHAADIARHAERIATQAGEVSRMVLNLLDYHRLQAEEYLQMEELDLSAVVRAVLARFASALAERRCELVVAGADRPIRGSWDRLALERILANLISNAIKYGAGKPVEVTLSGIPMGACIVVRDHGRGMPPEERRVCFEPFRRGAARNQASGHGLGLWIAKRMVDAHAGRVSVDPSITDGTAFRVELPLLPRHRRISWARTTAQLASRTVTPAAAHRPSM